MHLTKQEVAKRCPVVSPRVVQAEQGVRHAVMSDAVRPTIKPPYAVPYALRAFAHHHANPRRPSVQNKAFDGFLTPRPRPA